MKKTAFVAHPWAAYTSSEYEYRQAMLQAEETAVAVWEQGHIVLCPQKNVSGLDGLLLDMRMQEGQLAFVEHVDLLILSGKWRIDRWCQEAMSIAEGCGIPMYEYRNRTFLQIISH